MEQQFEDKIANKVRQKYEQKFKFKLNDSSICPLKVSGQYETLVKVISEP